MTRQELRDRLMFIIQELDRMNDTPEDWSSSGIAPQNVNKYFTPKQAQEYLSIKPSTFYSLIKKGKIPPGRYIGAKTRRWTKDELDGRFI